MRSGPHLTRLAALLIAITGSLSLAANGQSAPPGNGSTPGSVLPREVVIPISVVNRFFSVTREASTGSNLTAVGNPKA